MVTLGWMVTGARLRELLAEMTGRYIRSTSTSAGAADGTTIVDTAIQPFDSSRIGDRWALATSGTNITEARRVSTISTSTITLTTGYTNQFALGVTYEILDYHPVFYTNAIARAVRATFPYLYRFLVDESLVVDNLLLNPSFELSESTGSITAFADYDATVEGTTSVTDASHGLSTGDVITISGTTNYNGTFVVTVIDTSTFHIRVPFVADDATGTWVEAIMGQSGTASGWTATAGTWTFPTGMRRVHGLRAATASASGAAAQLTQNLYTQVNYDQVVGRTLHIQGWNHAQDASAARFRVTFDGSTFTNGDYHVGSHGWEGPGLQQIRIALPADLTQMTVYCEIADGFTAFFDLVTAWIDPISTYRLPAEFMAGGPHKVKQQVRVNEPNGEYLPLGPGNPPTAGRILRLEGMSQLTVPTADQMPVEVSEQQAELIVEQAAAYLHQTLMREDASNRAGHEADMNRHQRNADILGGRPGITMAPMSAHRHHYFSFGNDFNGRLLHLSRSRL